MCSGRADGRWRLVADIGGTNARFALADAAGQVQGAQTLACDDFVGPAEAALHYLGLVGVSGVAEAAIAVATAVVGDRVALTNRPDWSFSIRALRSQLDLGRLRVINDFTALALALPRLQPEELRQVGGGSPDRACPRAVLGPGTGLGVSGLIPSPGGWVALAGEGGHVTFGAADTHEIEVQRILSHRFGHVSAERVLSGPGLVNLYEAYCELAGEPAEELTPAQIADQGLSGQSVLCQRVLHDFCAMLGTLAGNLVLTLGARGGVYIGGGIVPKLGAFFDHSGFRERFEARGRFSTYLAKVPSYVVHAKMPALRGAAAALDQPSSGGCGAADGC